MIFNTFINAWDSRIKSADMPKPEWVANTLEDQIRIQKDLGNLEKGAVDNNTTFKEHK